MALLFTNKKQSLLNSTEVLIIDLINKANTADYTVEDDLIPFISEIQNPGGLLMSCPSSYIMGEVNTHTNLILKMARRVARMDGMKLGMDEQRLIKNLVGSYFISMMFNGTQISKSSRVA